MYNPSIQPSIQQTSLNFSHVTSAPAPAPMAYQQWQYQPSQTIDNMENTKRHLSLDFTKHRQRNQSGIGQTTSGLTTPILNLTTPELTRMVSEYELAVLTPNGIASILPQSSVLPSPLMPTRVISYNNNNNNNNNHNHNHNGTTTTPNTNNNDDKESPVNTHNNDNHNASQGDRNTSDSNQRGRIDPSREEKLRAKRERNRRAAANCRRRKDEKLEKLQEENEELRKTIESLQETLRMCISGSERGHNPQTL